jgi:malate/lactate dehydrogenase
MKISIIGASGKVAQQIVQAAYYLNTAESIEIALVGQHSNLVKRHIMDLESSRAFLPTNVVRPSFIATNSFLEASNSDYIFVCAGKFMAPEKKEQFRKLDPSGRLAHTFESLFIIQDIAKNIKIYSPHARVIMITNQSDMIADIVRNILPAENVYGFGGMLDEARFKKILSCKINKLSSGTLIRANEVEAEIIGYHNNDMVLIKDSVKLPECAQNILENNNSLLQEAMQETKDYGRDISKQKDSRHPTVHAGASIGPGFACWTCIAALSGQITSLKASFNTCLDKEQLEFYGLERATHLSVPTLISSDGFSQADRAKCSKGERESLKKAIINMDDNMRLLETLQNGGIKELKAA